MTRSARYAGAFVLGWSAAAGSIRAQGPMEPLRLERQAAIDKSMMPLLGEWRAPFHDGDNPACVWRGQWLFDGHLMALQCTGLPKGSREGELDVFGYSGQGNHFFMLRIMSESAKDSIAVHWFTINGDTWTFLAANDGGSPPMETQWRFDRSNRIVVRTSAPPSESRPFRAAVSPEMRRLADWRGRVPNKHDEPGFSVDGIMEFRPLAGGAFIGLFEWNTIVSADGKKTSGREVDVWAYSVSARRYYRLDIPTDGPEFQAPSVDLVTTWTSEGRNALLLASPLESKSIDGKSVTSRFGWEFTAGRMKLYGESSADGVHWTGRHFTWDVAVTLPHQE